MEDMFYRAISFNQDLSLWDVSKVSDMNGMFFIVSVFDKELSEWNICGVTNMLRVFVDTLIDETGSQTGFDTYDSWKEKELDINILESSGLNNEPNQKWNRNRN